MHFLFLLCAVIGGTVFVVQFALSLLGLGGEHVDLPGDFDLDADLDVDLDSTDAGSIEGHGSTRLFGILSLRTVTAAIAFFGLGGLFMSELTNSPLWQVVVAVIAGGGALYGVHYVTRSLYRLRHDGTTRIEWLVGESATVYVPIPAAREGHGKVQVRTKGGIHECAAVTSDGQTLPTGTVVRVVQVVGPSLVEVERETATDVPA